MKAVFIGLSFLLLAGCDAVRQSLPAAAPSAATQREFEYRIVSIDRNVIDLSYARSRSVSFTGKIEFTELGEGERGNAILYAKLRTETEAGTDENDIVVLLQDGRGEYEGSLRYFPDMPLNQPAPELRSDQVSLTVIGVVPLEAASLVSVNAPATTAPPAPASQ